MDKMELLQAMMEDENLDKNMGSAATTEEVREVFRGYGIEMTDEEADKMEVRAGEELAEECELSEDDLDQVAGGATIRRVVHTRRIGVLLADHIYIYRNGRLVSMTVKLRLI
jgi:predicted ribosomally synthesized peptide with nif11-like leader